MANFIKVTKAVTKGKTNEKIESIINIDHIRFIDNNNGRALVYFENGKFDQHNLNGYNPLLLDDKFEDILSKVSPESNEEK